MSYKKEAVSSMIKKTKKNILIAGKTNIKVLFGD